MKGMSIVDSFRRITHLLDSLELFPGGNTRF